MDEIGQLAELFKALSDPTRLRLVRLLRERAPERSSGECDSGQLCVNALANELGVTHSAVSQHLRILRQARLVRRERRGAFVHYSLDPDGLDRYGAALKSALGNVFVTAE